MSSQLNGLFNSDGVDAMLKEKEDQSPKKISWMQKKGKGRGMLTKGWTENESVKTFEGEYEWIY